MGRINPLIGLGIPSWGRVTLQWARAYRSLGGPLGSSMVEFTVLNTAIAEARNQLMRDAFNAKCEFLFMLGDDVIAPGNTIVSLLQRLRDNPNIDLATGVYWTKAEPTQPYLWRDMQRGPFTDWKLGEFLPVDFAGCDCLLIRLSDRVRALGPEWFSTTWLWESEHEKPSPLATEDFFFYTKARKAGIRLWADTAVQCLHEDRTSGMLFGLTFDMPQAGGDKPALPGPAAVGRKVVVADVGCGTETPYFGAAEDVEVWRFDGNEKVNPTYRCDVRQLPVGDQAVDVLHSRHVLEHFQAAEAPRVLAEWLRILRVGGELRLCLPNVLEACRRVLAIEAGERLPEHYCWWQLYGQQADEHDLHHNGFTPRKLRRLLELSGVLADIEVREGDGGINLYATARKAQHVGAPMVLTDAWEEIGALEGAAVAGLAPRVEADGGETAGPADDPRKAGATALEILRARGAGVPSAA